jgi:hypothetical protein
MLITYNGVKVVNFGNYNLRRVLSRLFVAAVFLFPFENIFSQTCGFGCLGLSGFYGGYSVEKYDAEGLNNFLNSFSPKDNLNFNMQKGEGLIVGMNIVRANYTDFFFTFKGYYQFYSETQEKPMNSDPLKNIINAKFEMNNWGFGLNFGIPLFSIFDWKVIEGNLSFYSPELTVQEKYDNYLVNEEIFSSDRVRMGFSLGSGLIIHVIRDYVSLEATGLYSFAEVDNLISEKTGIKIPAREEKLILQGGIIGIVQLNVGIPF